MPPVRLTLLMVALMVTAAGGMLLGPQDPPPAPGQTGSQPAAAARGPVVFQPGVWIDWQRREVQVQTRVVLRAGPLEFLACLAGKEHESVVRFEASAVHLYMALGLLGLLPGHPPTWDPQSGAYGPPAGDLLDLSWQWHEQGRTRIAEAYDWLRDVEYARPPLARPWVFAGSIKLPDGGLAADLSGVGVALVDFPDSLISLSRRHPSRYGALWAEANTPAIPPVGTPVRLVMRPAAARRLRVVVDHVGAAWVNGRYCGLADLADLLDLAWRQDPEHRVSIAVRGALRADVRGLRLALVERGIPAEALRFVREGLSTTQAASRDGPTN